MLCLVLGMAEEAQISSYETRVGLQVAPHPALGEEVGDGAEAWSLFQVPQPMDTMTVTLLLVTLCQSLFPAAGLGRVCSIPAGCQEPTLESVLFNQGKCEVLPLGRSSPRHQDVLGITKLESSSIEKDLEVLLGTSLTMRCQLALGAKRFNVEER